MAKNPDVVTVSEGRSGAYFAHALVCLVVAFPAVLIWSSVFPTYDDKDGTVSFDEVVPEEWLILVGILLLFYLGFVFFYSGTGVQFNKNTHQWRSYSSFLGARFGKWVSLPDFMQEVQLRKEYELNPNYDSRTKRKTDVNYIAYRLVCVHSGNKDVLLYEFTEYKPAYQFLEIINLYSGVPIWDQVVEQQQEAKKRRAHRGRR
ncbi:MAG: hypothetical protein ACPGED_10110 [Flavobacteriales bacterium]